MIENEALETERNLSDKDLAILHAELSSQRKSTGLAYFLFLLFGGLGIHKFYLGKADMGVLYIILGVGAAGLSFFSLTQEGPLAGALNLLTIIVLLCLACLYLYDLFTIPKQVKDHETAIKLQLLDKFK